MLTDSDDFGPCPACHTGTIIETSRAFGCDQWQGADGCKFTIWKTVAGKTLTPDIVRQLLTGQPTEPIDGFLSKKGNFFTARLQLEETNTGRCRFIFDPR